MFARLGTIPPFFDERSESIFGNIGGSAFDSDVTMIATLRSLLYPRINKDESFTFSYKTISLREFEDRSVENIFFDKVNMSSNSIRFVGVLGNTDEIVAKLYSKLDDQKSGAVASMSQHYSAFQELPDLKMYFKAKANIDCRLYIDPENNICICFFNMSSMNVRYHHLFVALIPRYTPSLFINHPLTAEEEAVCKSLTEKSADEYLKCISKLADNIDIRTILIEKMLSGFEKKIKRRQLEGAKEQLRDIDENIENFTRKYTELICNRENVVIRIEGINALMNKASDDTELINYLTSNKSIDLLSVDDSYINIIVATYLSTFDVEAYNTFKRDGSIYKDYYITNNPFNDVKDRKLLLDNIFNDDPLLKVKMCAYYRLDVRGEVKVSRSYDYPRRYDAYIPNPHLQRHACLNQNKALIEEQLRRGETIGAIECCMASAKAVNVLETSQTFRPMLEQILNSTAKIIENNEGVEMTPAEALEWLKAKQNA